ncbi:MAG TPA: helix-turn-helix domain-containing protein, partial [Verrucomicrobiae bacterium]
ELLAAPVADLARACGCSVRHFNRLFRQRFGSSFHTHQRELRLQRARQLLRESDSKITEVALDSGFRHTGLFNTFFKRRFGVTPSAWRDQGMRKRVARRSAPLRVVFSVAALAFALAVRAEDAPAPKLFAAVAPPPATNPPAKTFQVLGYEVLGNTVLTPDMIVNVVKDYIGANKTFDDIRAALTELQLAYRGRGYVTVSVSLPQQRLTNGVVKVQVTEGRLADIQVVDNHWFSSNNVLRALPSLRTNTILNSLAFQQELDRANASRDRQIYPVIGPGPEPGTTALTLKVKDRFPLHGRLDFNNQFTPGTPEQRLNTSLQFNNLWDREHQVGLQYGFTPLDMKSDDRLPRFFDQPLVANYSAFYRMPLDFAAADALRREVKSSEFGYDEVTHRFRPPALTGHPEMIFYGSRSDSDSGVRLGAVTVAAQTPLVTISSQPAGQDLTVNENLGTRLTLPLWESPGSRSVFSAGIDFKAYRLTSFNTNVFITSTTLTNAAGQTTNLTTVVPFSQPANLRHVDYLPLTVGVDTLVADKFGSTSFSVSASLNPQIFSGRREFVAAVYSTNATAAYHLVNFGIAREQKLFGEWTLSVRANGQWTCQPLLNNEQFGIGGLAGVRGYLEGEEYGDTGWRVLNELRSPLVNIGYVDGDLATYVRAVAFTDYGERYLLDAAPGRAPALNMWGAGVGLSMTIG